MDITQELLYRAIGIKIRAIRNARGWTQEQLGNKLEVSAQYISRIERGAGHLSLRKLYTIADALECSIYSIFEELIAMVSQMDDRYRAPLELKLQGYQVKEIATILNITQENVKVRIFRARRMILDKLESYYGQEGE